MSVDDDQAGELLRTVVDHSGVVGAVVAHRDVYIVQVVARDDVGASTAVLVDHDAHACGQFVVEERPVDLDAYALCAARGVDAVHNPLTSCAEHQEAEHPKGAESGCDFRHYELVSEYNTWTCDAC